MKPGNTKVNSNTVRRLPERELRATSRLGKEEILALIETSHLRDEAAPVSQRADTARPFPRDLGADELSPPDAFPSGSGLINKIARDVRPHDRSTRRLRAADFRSLGMVPLTAAPAAQPASLEPFQETIEIDFEDETATDNPVPRGTGEMSPLPRTGEMTPLREEPHPLVRELTPSQDNIPIEDLDPALMHEAAPGRDPFLYRDVRSVRPEGPLSVSTVAAHTPPAMALLGADAARGDDRDPAMPGLADDDHDLRMPSARLAIALSVFVWLAVVVVVLLTIELR